MEAFWSDSPNATVFTCPEVISELSAEVHWWMAYKGDTPVCLWPVAVNEDGAVDLPPFSYYVGPMWSLAATKRPAHRTLSELKGVYEPLIESLVGQYGTIHAQLPLGLDDVRVFDWWNCQTPAEPRFHIAPRYTALITNIDDASATEVVAGFRAVRRQELRRIDKNGVPRTLEHVSGEQLQALYVGIMHRQGIYPSEDSLVAIDRLEHLVQRGHGAALAYSLSGSRDPDAALIVLIAKGTANLVLNLTRSDAKSTGLPAWSASQAILAAKEMGCHTFDFNGANSPSRGDDKHSYGATARLYFELGFET